MLLVTGGAGFIGSNVVAALNEAGRSDIVVNDVLGGDSKWRNLGKRQVADVIAPPDLLRWLDHRKLDGVIHMGAISDTTATDADLVMENNFRLSTKLLDWCTERAQRRSSMRRRPRPSATAARVLATTGRSARAEAARADESLRLEQASVRPDPGRARRQKQKLPPQWAGLKFFNVFGPNEYHKGEMMSLVAKRFDDAKSGRPVQLFKSHRDGRRRWRAEARLHLCR